MEALLIFALILLIIGFGVVIYFLLQFQKRPLDDSALNILSQNLQGLQQRIDETTRAINERLDNAAMVVGNVRKELGQVQEIGRQMQSLQEFLHSPKLRGNIGEQVLKDLLAQHLPKENYQFQYKFKDGETVDAVIKLDQGLIPIDAKFPAENFKRMLKEKDPLLKEKYSREFARDVKKHILDIARKYIKPMEKTLDFAVMYVPAEPIYYEILTGEEHLDDFAHQNRVLVVSPNSFFYLLKVIMIGLEGKKLSEASQQILDILNHLRGDSMKLGEHLSVLSRHITNAKNSMDLVNLGYQDLVSKLDGVKFIKKEKINKPLELDNNEEEVVKERQN